LDDIEEKCLEFQKLITKKFKPLKIKEGDIAIVDVDDTAISSGSVVDLRSEYVPALPAVLNLYKFLKLHGVRVVFITSRKLKGTSSDPLSDRNTILTRKQLINAGYSGEDELFLRPPTQKAGFFKYSKRAELSGKHQILLNIGDNDYDFETGPRLGAKAFINILLPLPGDILRDLQEDDAGDEERET
jgi:hypothetical protein